MLFNASEVYQIAISVEENGEMFYREVCKRFDEKRDDNIIKLFNFLADAETLHKNTFEEMLSTFEEYEIEQSFPEEYFVYLKKYIGNNLFTKEALKRSISKMVIVDDVIEFAKRRELDTILFYQEIKNLVPEEQKEKIDYLIEQERDHFKRLSDLQLIVEEKTPLI